MHGSFAYPYSTCQTFEGVSLAADAHWLSVPNLFMKVPNSFPKFAFAPPPHDFIEFLDFYWSWHFLSFSIPK